MAKLEDKIAPIVPKEKIIFKEDVVIGGVKNIPWTKRFRSKALSITNKRILIDNLISIPLASVIKCKLYSPIIQLEYIDSNGLKKKLSILAPPKKFRFKPFPANQLDELEFIENLYDRIIELIPKTGYFWESIKNDTEKKLDDNKIKKIKLKYAKQLKHKQILTYLIVPLLILCGLFILIIGIFKIKLTNKYEAFFLFIGFLFILLTIGLIYISKRRCPHCKGVFTSTAKFCRKCGVQLIDDDNLIQNNPFK